MQATTFHVATTGSDANNGSAGAPWLTIGKCVSAMQGGDTCLVHAGTYAESTLYLPNGTSGAPTTLQANPGDTVTINSPSRTNDCMICFHLGAQWQVVDGFILDGLAITKFIVNTDDNSKSDFHHLTIQNCEMRNSLYSGMLISGDNWKVLGNNIHHNGTDATLDHGIYFSASQSLIQNNTVHNNKCYNIQNYNNWGLDISNNTYDRNTFYNSGCGLVLVQGGSHTVTNNVQHDDATFGPGGAPGGEPTLWCCGPGSKVSNNTLVHNFTGGIISKGEDSGDTVTNNISCENTGGADLDMPNSTQSGNRTGTCPAFVDRANNDYRLASGDTSVGANLAPGSPTGAVTTPVTQGPY